MEQRRRAFLAAAAGLALGGSQPSYGRAYGRDLAEDQGTSRDCSGLEGEILGFFSDLPDRKACKIWSPANGSGPEFLAQLHQKQRMFVASTNKALILCERLRQLDSPTIEREITEHELALNEGVWSPGSAIFNPPALAGLVSERTAMEAMVVHSDNTATDMVLKQAGADKVRNFIASIGLESTMIPDSTRSLAGYLAGALKLQDHHLG